MEELAVKISDKMKDHESKALYIPSAHNFKITLDLFHAMANTFQNDKQIAILYYMLKGIDSGSMITVRNKFVYEKLEMSRQAYARVVDRMLKNNIIKSVHVKNQTRGMAKYMVNPGMIYNFKKTKSNEKYNENIKLWEYLA